MKMLNILLFILVVHFSLVFNVSESCGLEKPVLWFVEIKDQCKTEFSTQLLSTVAKNLNGKIYVATHEHKIILQETAKIRGKKRDKDISTHKFVMPTEDIQVRVGDGKIYMCFNPPNEEGLYNADFLLFLYRKDNTWERVLNPGNFRFKKGLTQIELHTKIRKLIVGLTFK